MTPRRTAGNGGFFLSGGTSERSDKRKVQIGK